MLLASWNVMRGTGAGPADVAALIAARSPDLVLLQEAGPAFLSLPALSGGGYAALPFEGRADGLGAWSPRGTPAFDSLPLPAGTAGRDARPRRAMVVRCAGWEAANVHLSHGQRLNRRQLAAVADAMRGPGAIVGDMNMAGPSLLPGWRDVGPWTPTHLLWGAVPLRLDRCLARGMHGGTASALPRGRSDHRPILVRLRPCAA